MTNTDDIRRDMIETGQTRDDLVANIGPTWDTAALQRDFEVTGFQAPFVVVKRRSDGAVGSLEFTHRPRVYFNWQAD
jgi:hypothetical protein